MPRVWMIVVVTLCLAVFPGAGAQSNSNAAGETAATILAIANLEQALLESDRQQFENLARQRADSEARIDGLRQSLDEAMRDVNEPDYRRIDLLLDQLIRARANRDVLLKAEREVVRRVTDHLERLELLGQQLDTQRAATETEERGSLTGPWDLVLMPAQQRGACMLRQTGAVITGTYQLEGGWTGSLQGTLVNRKVFLVRIDSQLGKSMELEGYLSSDGKRIRGSWLSYELAGSEGSTGQWSAQRRTGQP